MKKIVIRATATALIGEAHTFLVPDDFDVSADVDLPDLHMNEAVTFVGVDDWVIGEESDREVTGVETIEEGL